MARTYADAIASLNTLQSNFAIVDAIRKSGRKMNEQAIPEMIEWCRKIGYNPSDFDRLNAIHIAGTKGKGSTAAFVSSILTQYLGQKRTNGNDKPLAKVALYTSPHLRFVRERIQINGTPLSEEQFAKYFFETWDRLEKTAAAEGNDPKSPTAKPVYFRFLTLMAFHTYMSEGVDAAIIECGIGGAYDSTNVLQRPVVTGITSLGIDHVGVLGSTLPEIAWHKAGIMKSGSTCFTPSSQHDDTKPVLQKVAAEQSSGLEFVDIDPRIDNGELRLGMEADFQKINGSLASAIAQEWLSKQSFELRDDRTEKGLAEARWSGRCETRYENNVTWCIDGGHTLDSIAAAGKWFAGVLNKNSESDVASDRRRSVSGGTARDINNKTESGLETATPLSTNIAPKHKYTDRVLIFNQQTRDASALATALHDTLATTLSRNLDMASTLPSPTSSFDSSATPSPTSTSTTTLPFFSPFTHAIFTTNTTYVETGFRPDLMSLNTNAADIQDLKVQHELAQTWSRLDSNCTVHVVRTIEEAVGIVRKQQQQQQHASMTTTATTMETNEKEAEKETIVLVTGSLHLVGGFLEVLDGTDG